MLDRTVWDIDPQLATQYRTRAPSLSRQHSVIPSFLAVNLCCHSSYIYRRALLPPAAAHRGDKLQPKGRLPPMNVYTSTCICLKCLSMFIHLSRSDNSGIYCIFILALAFTLALMRCIILIIACQFMRISYLRGFSASARSYLTVLLNLIRGNPDVLVRNPGFFWQQGTKGQFLHCKLHIESLPMQMFTGTIRLHVTKMLSSPRTINWLFNCNELWKYHT